MNHLMPPSQSIYWDTLHGVGWNDIDAQPIFSPDMLCDVLQAGNTVDMIAGSANPSLSVERVTKIYRGADALKATKITQNLFQKYQSKDWLQPHQRLRVGTWLLGCQKREQHNPQQTRFAQGKAGKRTIDANYFFASASVELEPEVMSLIQALLHKQVSVVLHWQHWLSSLTDERHDFDDLLGGKRDSHQQPMSVQLRPNPRAVDILLLCDGLPVLFQSCDISLQSLLSDLCYGLGIPVPVAYKLLEMFATSDMTTGENLVLKSSREIEASIPRRIIEASLKNLLEMITDMAQVFASMHHNITVQAHQNDARVTLDAFTTQHIVSLLLAHDVHTCVGSGLSQSQIVRSLRCAQSYRRSLYYQPLVFPADRTTARQKSLKRLAVLTR